MNAKYLSTAARVAACITVLACGANLRAATSSTAQTLNVAIAGQNQFQPMAFSDSAEAGMLHRAYRILATGDHDYKGHRAKAMHAVEAAAKLLGLDLSGDAKDREKQVLSDDKMREAQGLISNVMNSAEVKDQKHVTKHLGEAMDQIKAALSVR
jgi:hypothetical protein